jgi:hypothetical protein
MPTKKEFIIKGQEVILVNGVFYRAKVTRYLNATALLHRERDEPALIAKVGNKIIVEEWYMNNKLYRKGKPARKEYKI